MITKCFKGVTSDRRCFSRPLLTQALISLGLRGWKGVTFDRSVDFPEAFQKIYPEV